jgi:hypothetical protein
MKLPFFEQKEKTSGYLKAIIVILVIAAMLLICVYLFRQLPVKQAVLLPEELIPNENVNPGNLASTDNSLFNKTASQLDSPDKIAWYLTENFSITNEEKETALSPQKFFYAKSGGPQDAAVFTAYVLDIHEFESGVVRYKGSINGQNFTHTVAIFRDKDLPKYLTANANSIKITAHGWSFRDLLLKEEERTGASISDYAFFSAGETNLTPTEWQKNSNSAN